MLPLDWGTGKSPPPEASGSHRTLINDLVMLSSCCVGRLFRAGVIGRIYRGLVGALEGTKWCNCKTSHLMLFREIITAFSEIHKRRMNTMSGRNLEFLSAKTSGS